MSKTIVGNFSSADASGLNEANSRISLYEQGSTSTITLTTTQRVLVEQINITLESALTVTIYDGADSTPNAGEQIWKGHLTEGISKVPVNFMCQQGTYPKVKTSGAGQIYVNMSGQLFN